MKARLGSEIMEKSSGKAEMDISIEMHSAISKLAGHRDWHDTRGRWLEKAAKTAGISYRQAKSLFYGETKDPKWSVVEKVRAARHRMLETQEARARDDRDNIVARLERLETLVSSGENICSKDIDALRKDIALCGGDAGSVDS